MLVTKLGEAEAPSLVTILLPTANFPLFDFFLLTLSLVTRHLSLVTILLPTAYC